MNDTVLPNTWAANLWRSLRDGGIWGLPRSGLVYTKDEAAKRMVLTMRVPWFAGLSASPEVLREAQDHDHAGVRDMFAAIGIDVVEEEG
ncbi:MAG TPA: hypothetical protein VEP28_08940 [Rubrobacter sp.]|nr:hypothetical protein [Rubrobacter sp.]